MFRDRIEAGYLLAARLSKYRDANGVVLAIPRGGVPIAYCVAKVLNLPLEIIFTKKIGHPLNKEYAIGAASLTDHFIIPHENVSQEYINQELQAVRKKLKDMYQRLMGARQPESLEGKTVILIDDGIATGNTIIATIAVLRKSKPAKIIIAVPVASPNAVEKLSREVDELVVLLVPEEFYGVGAFYEDFEQVSDEEVKFYLDQLKDIPKAV